MLVESVSALQQLAAMALYVFDIGLSKCQGALEVLEHGLLIRLVAMQFKTHVSQADIGKSTVNNIQRRHFLRHKQNRFTAGHSRSNQVGDRLRFARAGRSLDNKISASFYFLDGQRLRTVSIDDVQCAEWIDQLVNLVVIATERRIIRKRVPQ